MNSGNIIQIDKIKRLITHSGSFHADDILATAWLRLCGCMAPVVRIRSADYDYKYQHGDFMYDIGFGIYDHHQTDIPKRMDSEIPYAAFGLIVKDSWAYLLDDYSAYIHFDGTFVQGIDGADNGLRKNDISRMFASMNVCWPNDSDEDLENAFQEALEIAVKILKAIISRENSIAKICVIAEDAIKNAKNGVIYTETTAPIGNVIMNMPDIQWIIHKSKRGTYSLKPAKNPCGEQKASIPKKYWGLPKEQLPEGMEFCHRCGYVASFLTLEYAIAFASNLKTEKGSC